MPSAKSALVLIANGTEELEAITAVDILRRASIRTVVASVGSISDHVQCSRDVKIVSDVKFDEMAESDKHAFDVLVLPGGLKGAETLKKTGSVLKLALHFFAQQKFVAAICAGPTVLVAAGIAKGYAVTSYPSLSSEFKENGYAYKEDNVVIDRYVITSRGPGTAMAFSLAIVEMLVGKDIRDKVASGLLAP